jgi:ferredoxin
VTTVLKVLLLCGAGLWLVTFWRMASFRAAAGVGWVGLTLVLGGVTLFTIGSAFVFDATRVKERYNRALPTARASAAAFLLTALTLAIVHVNVTTPVMLLLERFVPGGGWMEIPAVSTYAAWLTEKMLEGRRRHFWRRRLWLFFSAVFFAQFLLGLLGVDRMLMTGKIHLPIPALILAGPIFRGQGLFMPILFCSTVLLTGAAWCSYLCYIGAWDHAASRNIRKPKPLPRWHPWVRLFILLAVVATAVGLRIAGVRPVTAATVALGFGVVGVALMVAWSRRKGVMAHCVVYCPIGLVADALGKVLPFRICFGDGCDECGVCSKVCRYDALTEAHVKARKVGFTCSLCGDCVGVCRPRALKYRFWGLGGDNVFNVFLVLVVSLHAVFLALARI